MALYVFSLQEVTYIKIQIYLYVHGRKYTGQFKEEKHTCIKFIGAYTKFAGLTNKVNL